MIHPPRTEVQRLLLGLLFVNSKRAGGPPQDPRANGAAERKGCLVLPLANQTEVHCPGYHMLARHPLKCHPNPMGGCDLRLVHQELSSTGALTPPKANVQAKPETSGEVLCVWFSNAIESDTRGRGFTPLKQNPLVSR